jgi:DNA-binding transcriptional ArsR family regulator
VIAAEPTGAAVSEIAACIAEPARTRMLYSLMDGHARTSTELAVVGGVSPSTASVHLNRLHSAHLISVVAQGKHRYYSLASASVARTLERLSVLAGRSPGKFVPNTPNHLRAARTCYDHVAGTVGVSLHHRFRSLHWLVPSKASPNIYEPTSAGKRGFQGLGIDIEAAMLLRRRFAYPCLDWSERQPHIAGALGSAVLQLALRKRWLTQESDSRAFAEHLGLEM